MTLGCAGAGVGIDWTFASLDDTSGSTWGGFLARSVAVLVSLGGLCITALMLGIVSEQISHVIEELKKGKSEVRAASLALFALTSDYDDVTDSVDWGRAGARERAHPDPRMVRQGDRCPVHATRSVCTCL